MNLKAGLVGGVAMGVALSFGMAGGVEAKVVKRHHHAPAGPSASEQALHEEVDALKAQVQSLESRLDSQSQAQQQTAATAQQAQSTAQTAQATAQQTQSQVAAEQAKIDTIPEQVEDHTKKYEPLLSGWFNNTKVGGVIFADFSDISNKANGVAVGTMKASNGTYNVFGNTQPAQNGVSYDIKRAYIIIDHRFNDVFSADITTDFTYDSVTKASQLYIKKAYLQADLYGPALIVRAGGADMPWVPFVENVYGYRFVDHVLIDNYSYGTSADWGLHAFGSFWDNHIGYAVSVIDGQGYKVTPQGTIGTSTGIVTTTNSAGDVTSVALTPTAGARSNGVDVEARLNANWAGFTAAVGGYDGHRGISDGAADFNVAERFDALLAYTNPIGRIGVEYLWADFWNDVGQSNPAKTNKTEGVSVFASVNFYRHFSVFGRWDYLKPQEDTAPNYHSNFFNVGLDYKPIDPIDIALVYKHESVIDGVLSTSNGSIGTTTPGAKGVYDEVGIFTGLKF